MTRREVMMITPSETSTDTMQPPGPAASPCAATLAVVQSGTETPVQVDARLSEQVKV